MHVIEGVDALRAGDGPLFVVVGVFDGLHRGHAYLLQHLVAEADRRAARPAVITFDHHPDEVLTGSAPPLLIEPEERLERLAAAGVAVTVVQRFDDALRQTTYDAFIERIRAKAALSGFLMTPDAAFGYERAGTPGAVTSLGERDGFEVVVVPPFELDGHAVRSSDIRAAVAAGDLETAHRLLGRPFTLSGPLDAAGCMTFVMPMALPPDGMYGCEVSGQRCTAVIAAGAVRIDGQDRPTGRVELAFRTAVRS